MPNQLYDTGKQWHEIQSVEMEHQEHQRASSESETGRAHNNAPKHLTVQMTSPSGIFFFFLICLLLMVFYWIHLHRLWHSTKVLSFSLCKSALWFLSHSAKQCMTLCTAEVCCPWHSQSLRHVKLLAISIWQWTVWWFFLKTQVWCQLNRKAHLPEISDSISSAQQVWLG